MTQNHDWLLLNIEETLDPDLPICDAHHHLWDGRDDSVEPRYLIEDFLRDTGSGHNIVSSVFIECGAMYRAEGPVAMRPLGETEFANGIAAMSASGQYGTTQVAKAIVGTVDLRHGEQVRDALEAHIAAANGRFCGIRQAVNCHADSSVPDHRTAPPHGLLMDRDFRSGFAHLAGYGLSFEVWCYHTQLGEATDLARQFPDTTIVLDHFGGPLGIGPYKGRAESVFADWSRDISELARCQNVMAKLGGLAMPVNGFNWHGGKAPPTSDELLNATRQYYEYTIEQFGVDRCLFESNFPVDKLSCSYNVLWNSFKKLTAQYTAGEKAKLFHDNASRIYKID